MTLLKPHPLSPLPAETGPVARIAIWGVFAPQNKGWPQLESCSSVDSQNNLIPIWYRFEGREFAYMRPMTGVTTQLNAGSDWVKDRIRDTRSGGILLARVSR